MVQLVNANDLVGVMWDIKVNGPDNMTLNVECSLCQQSLRENLAETAKSWAIFGKKFFRKKSAYFVLKLG